MGGFLRTLEVNVDSENPGFRPEFSVDFHFEPTSLVTHYWSSFQSHSDNFL